MARKKDKKSSQDKPAADVYTALLGLTLLALIVGSVFLYLEMDRYKFEIKPGAAGGPG